MKKPRKPRKPEEPRYFLAYLGNLVKHVSKEDENKPVSLENFGKNCVAFARKGLVEKLGFDENHIQNEHLVLIGSQLFWEAYKAPEEALKRMSTSYVAKVKRYKKSLKAYKTKLKQYNINLSLWEAWQLGKHKDKLAAKKLGLKKRLKTVEEELGEVEKKIEKKLQKSEEEDAS